MADYCYVYAIGPQSMSLPESLSGFGGMLRAVACRDLAAVVSSPATGEVEPAPENLLRHEQIVEAMCARGAALPVRFGTVLAHEELLRRALAERYETLRDDMRRLAGTLEFGVTVLWRRGPDTEPLSDPDERMPDLVNRGPATAHNGGRGTAYLRARWAQYRQDEVLRERAQAVGETLEAALRPHAVACHRTLCPSAHLALRDLYLTRRAAAGAFEEAVEDVRIRHTEVRLLLSGPWPPYSFVTQPH